MFEFIPFLEGKYLNYQEYFVFCIIIVCLLLFALSQSLYRFALGLSKTKVHLSGGRTKNFQIKRLAVVYIACIFLLISRFFLSLGIISVSALDLQPTYTSILILLFLSMSTLNQLIEVIATRQHRRFRFTKMFKNLRVLHSNEPQLFWVLITFCMAYSLGLPLLFHKTCICEYEKTSGADIAIDAFSINTAFTRMFTYRDPCSNTKVPCHVYATLPEDATHSVFINFHLNVQESVEVQFGGKSYESTVFPYEIRTVHSVYVGGLEENTPYSFTILGQEYWYKTLPEEDKVIVSGGDVGTSQNAKEVWQQVPADTDVIFIGGDIAYDNNMPACFFTWDLFLGDYDAMSQRVGRIVPIVLAIGNHDVGLNANPHREIAYHDAYPIYFSFFPQHQAETPQKGVPSLLERRSYFHHDLGNLLYFTLDTDYKTSIFEQSSYIDQVLRENGGKTIRFAQYHVPVFSGCQTLDFERVIFEEGVLEWVSRFDKHDFQTVFENHVHTQKRTKPIKGFQHDPRGTVYLGDGSWGAAIATCEGTQYKYLDNIQREASMWVTRIKGDVIEHSAITNQGNVSDFTTQAIL